MNKQLKPCPFCGGEAAQYDFIEKITVVNCVNSCINGDPTDGDLPDVLTWNTRPIEDALQDEINKLKVESEKLLAALSEIANWEPSPYMTLPNDNPKSIAREALRK